MSEFFAAIGTAIFQKVVDSKGFSILIIGILLFINFTNLLFPLNFLIDLKSNHRFYLFIDLVYLILYLSISLLIIFSLSFYLSFLIYCITYSIIDKSELHTSKFFNRIVRYSFSTSQQSGNNYETAFEWSIISFLLLVIFDKENILVKATELYNTLFISNSLSAIPIYFIIIPAIPSTYVILVSLYTRFLTEPNFYFDADKYD